MTKKLDIEFPRDFYLDDVGVWRLNKEKITELERSTLHTNEEYIHSLNTEQLAEWISKVTIDAWFRQVNNELPKPNGAKEWVEWLKQPHNS